MENTYSYSWSREFLDVRSEINTILSSRCIRYDARMNENERVKRATFKTKGKFRAVASVGASQFLLVLNGERVLRNGNSGTGTSNCSRHKMTMSRRYPAQ